MGAGAGFEPGTIEVILCDADGCLFPSEEPAFAASAIVTNEFLATMGAIARFDGEELRLATTGQNFRTTAARLAEEEGIEVDPFVLEQWVDEERFRVTAHLGRTLVPDPAVIGPLARLGRDRRLAVVSSSALPRIEVCLAAAGLEQLFPRWARFSAESSLPRPTSKPDPAVYLLAGESLEVEAHQALAIEDSVPGAEAAIAAGFPTLGNVTFVPPAERQDRIVALIEVGVRGIIQSWGELEQLLAGQRLSAAPPPRRTQGAVSPFSSPPSAPAG
jgi:HAD superfamily hydrolase (TIGR01509 family)